MARKDETKPAFEGMSMRERIRQRAKESKSGGGLSTLILPKGAYLLNVQEELPENHRLKLDVIPYRVTSETHPNAKPGDLYDCRPFFVHKGIGVDEKTVVCLKSVGKRCPICDEQRRLAKDPEADEDVVEALRAKKRTLFNVLIDGEEKVRVWDVSHFLFTNMLEEELAGGDEENLDYASIKKGKTLKIKFREKSFNGHKFYEATNVEFIERQSDVAAVADQAADLDECLKVMDEEELDKLFNSAESEGSSKPIRPDARVDDDVEEDTDPAPAKPSKKPAADEDEDEDDDDEPAKPKGKKGCKACGGSGLNSKGRPCVCTEDMDEDEDEDEEEAKPKGKKPAKEDDEDEASDDDDDWGDDDDEEDEKPPKTKRK